MSELKQCSNCQRWTKPLLTSACNAELSDKDPLPYKKNQDGLYYCDDFKSKAKKEKASE